MTTIATADDIRSAVLARFSDEIGNDADAITEIRTATAALIATYAPSQRFGYINITITASLLFADGSTADADDPVEFGTIRQFDVTDSTSTLTWAARKTFPELTRNGVPVVAHRAGKSLAA